MLFVLDDEVMELGSDFGQFLQMNFLFVVKHIFHSLEVFFLDHHLEIFCLSFFGQSFEGCFCDFVLVWKGDF